jgi:putative redox protein
VTTKTSVTWLGEMQFDAEVEGHHITLDVSSNQGGNDSGPSPKPLLLISLAGCTGMDVVSIMRKMRIENFALQMDVQAESTLDMPVVYHTIHLHYHFTGPDLPRDKILHAIELSQTQYCGVSAMLRTAATINTRIFFNGKEIE